MGRGNLQEFADLKKSHGKLEAKVERQVRNAGSQVSWPGSVLGGDIESSGIPPVVICTELGGAN